MGYSAFSGISNNRHNFKDGIRPQSIRIKGFYTIVDDNNKKIIIGYN